MKINWKQNKKWRDEKITKSTERPYLVRIFTSEEGDARAILTTLEHYTKKTREDKRLVTKSVMGDLEFIVSPASDCIESTEMKFSPFDECEVPSHTTRRDCKPDLLLYVSRKSDDYDCAAFWRSADQYHLVRDAYPRVAMAKIKVDLKIYDLLGTYTKVIDEIMKTIKQKKEERKRTKKVK